MNEFDRAAGSISREPAAADRGEIGRADHISDTAGGFRKDAEWHPEDAVTEEVETRRDAGEWPKIDVGLTKIGGGTCCSRWVLRSVRTVCPRITARRVRR